MRQLTYDGLTFEPFIEKDKIERRVKEIAAEISRDYAGRNPLFLCVLKGAFPFAADLIRAVDIDAEISFIRLKSYEGTTSTGAHKEIMGLHEDIQGRPVIVIEDIVDTGHTIVRLLDLLGKKNPSDVKVATLLYKPEANEAGVVPDYVGFSIPRKFIIGYGLDIDEKARNLGDIWVKTDD